MSASHEKTPDESPVPFNPDETLDAPPTYVPPTGPRDSSLPTAIDRFTILRQLGQGGMGDVFLARHPVTGTEVAIKRLRPSLVRDPQAVHRFLTEARHMYHLNHPNILRIMEVLDPPAGPYYVMPYMPVGSLAMKLRPGQPADYVTTIRAARDVADALVYAHGKGIIHRDLKPGNVLMDTEGTAYLADFGLVRTVFNDSVTDIRQSQTLGTAPYMSPAVARGEAEDTRCDIYSFGAMLYELLTGHPPYEGRSSAEVVGKVVAGPPKGISKHNPHAPVGLVRIAEGCMARELRDRYTSMADVLTDLERVEKGKLPLGPHGKASGGGVRKAPLIAAAAMLLLLAIGAIGAWIHFSKKPDTAGSAASQPAAPVVVAATGGTPATTAVLKSATTPAPTNPRTVDLMPFIDPDKDNCGPGTWTMKNRELRSGDQEQMRLSIPYAPPEEYDFVVEFTRESGSDSVTQGFTSHGSQANWVVGADNNTTRYFETREDDRMERAVCSLTNGVRSRSTVHVRKEGITAELSGKDGVARIRLPDEPEAFHANQPWAFDPRGLSVGSWHSSTIFHKIELIEITGTGAPIKRIREAGLKDLLANGDFSDGRENPSNWNKAVFAGTLTAQRDPERAPGVSTMSLRLDWDKAVIGRTCLTQEISLPARGALCLTGYYKTNPEFKNLDLRFELCDERSHAHIVPEASPTWTRFEVWIPLPFPSARGKAPVNLLVNRRGMAWLADFHLYYVPDDRPWPAQTALVSTCGGDSQPLWKMGMLPEGILVAQYGPLTRSFDPFTGAVIRTWDSESYADLTPDGRFLFGNSQLINVVTTKRIKLPTEGYSNPRISPDGRIVAMELGVEGGKSVIRVFDAKTASCVKVLNSRNYKFRGVHHFQGWNPFSADGKLYVLDDADGDIEAYDTATWELIGSRPGKSADRPQQWAKPFPTGMRVLVASAIDLDASVVIWDAKTGKELPLAEHVGALTPSRLSVSPDGRYIAYAKNESTSILDSTNGETLAGCEYPPPMKQWVYASWMTFSPDSKRILIGYYDGKCYLFDVASGKLLARFYGEQGAVRPIVFSPDGKLAATAHPAEGNIIRVWKMPEPGAAPPPATAPASK